MTIRKPAKVEQKSVGKDGFVVGNGLTPFVWLETRPSRAKTFGMDQEDAWVSSQGCTFVGWAHTSIVSFHSLRLSWTWRAAKPKEKTPNERSPWLSLLIISVFLWEKAAKHKARQATKILSYQQSVADSSLTISAVDFKKRDQRKRWRRGSLLQSVDHPRNHVLTRFLSAFGLNKEKRWRLDDEKISAPRQLSSSMAPYLYSKKGSSLMNFGGCHQEEIYQHCAANFGFGLRIWRGPHPFARQTRGTINRNWPFFIFLSDLSQNWLVSRHDRLSPRSNWSEKRWQTSTKCIQAWLRPRGHHTTADWGQGGK